MRESRESVCWGGADQNRNVKKLSYATTPNGIKSKTKGMEAWQKPHGGKEREDGGEVGECMGACSSMLSRSLRVKTKVRARMEKDDLASIIPNRLGSNLLCYISER